MHTSALVLSHTLDRNFASRLAVALIPRGISATAVSLSSFDLHANRPEIALECVIVILRSEFLKTPELMTILRSSDAHNTPIFPVIRAPIDLTRWPTDIAFEEPVDFTDHDDRYFSERLNDLVSIISVSLSVTKPTEPSLIEAHISKVLLNTQRNEYLEQHYYPEEQLAPSQCYIEDMHFGVRTDKLSPIVKNDSLRNIISFYPRIIVETLNLQCYTIVDYVTRLAIKNYVDDPVHSPVPVVLDISNGLIDGNWLKRAMRFSKTPYKDVNQGNILLILSGLEKAADSVKTLFELLDQKIEFTSPSLRLIVVSPHSLPNQLTAYNNITIQPITIHFSNIQELAKKYQSHPLAKFILSITDLELERQLRYFILSPILLAQLLSVRFEEGINFSGLGISEYYKTLIDVLWENGCQVNNDHESKLEAVIPSLAKLAALLTNQGRSNFDLTDAIKLFGGKFVLQTCVDGGLLRQISDNICFAEKHIQEYFAAIALQEFGLPSKLPKLILDTTNERKHQLWDASLILLTHLLPENEKLFDVIIKLDPLLALDAVNSGCPIAENLYAQIIEENLLLLRQLGDFRVAFAQRLQTIDGKAAKDVLLETMRESNWGLRVASFSLFNELHNPLSPSLVSALIDTANDYDDALIYAIRRIGSDAVITLLQLLQHDDAIIRKKSAWILGRLDDKVACPALVTKLEDVNQDVILESIEALALLGDFQTLEPLALMTKRCSPKVTKAIRSTLAQMLQDNPSEFTKITQKLDSRSRHIVVLLTSKSITQSTLNFALTFSYDIDPDVRIAALEGLRNSNDDRAIARLKECIRDTEKSNVRKYTVNEIATKLLTASGLISTNKNAINTKESSLALDKRKSSEIVKSRLIQAKTTNKELTVNPSEASGNDVTIIERVTTEKPSDEDLRVASILKEMREHGWDASNEAAKQLRDYAKQLRGKASTYVMNQIIETLNDSDWVIRWTGVETLGWIGNIHVVPHLIQRLADENWKIRVAAIRALAEIKDDSAIGAIAETINDTHSVVREAAAEALGSLGSDKTLLALEKASTDSEEFVRLAAVESLGKIKHKLAVSSLLSSLKDKSDHVRWAAANGLIGIASPQIASVLIPSLNDNGGPYWEQKRICDVIADILDQLNTDETKNALTLWRNSQAQSSN